MVCFRQSATNSIFKTIWGNEPKGWLAASLTSHILSNCNNVLLNYANGDEDWRKEQNERFAMAMTTAGNFCVLTKEVPNRIHSTLLSAISDNDDKLTKLIIDFVLNE